MESKLPHSGATIQDTHIQALNDLKKARRFAILAPLILLVLLIVGIWARFDSFAKNEGHQIPATILKKSPEALGPIAGLSLESLKRVAPVYQKEIYKVYLRDQHIYAKLIQNEVNHFMTYASAMGVSLQERFSEFSSDTLTLVEDRLAPNMSDKELDEFRVQTALHLYALLNEEVEENWQAHVDQIKITGNQLYAISLQAPAKELPPQYLLGSTLELIGLYLQQNNF